MTEKNNTNISSTPKPKGRPKGTGVGNEKMLRVLITPRQNKLLSILRHQGLSESEHCRRALDEYLDKLIERGALTDI